MDNYLYHHGILGQKWGVRRYQNEDGSLTAAGKKRIQQDGKGFIARKKIRTEGRIHELDDQLENARDLIKKPSLKKIADAYDRFYETGARNNSFTEKRLAAASRTKFGQRYHETAAQNYQYAANYWKGRQKADVGERIVRSILGDPKVMNVPYQRMSGRKTTVGREVANRVLTFGLGGLAADAIYLAKNKKK